MDWLIPSDGQVFSGKNVIKTEPKAPTFHLELEQND